MERGAEVVGLDRRGATPNETGDVRDPDAVRAAVDSAHGIIHLAAVSRVIWGERDPATCHSTNVDGTRNVLEAAAAAPRRPWVLFASSREVYGQAERLPVAEDAPHRPMNVYARTKVAGELLVEEFRMNGHRGATVRLSNVYGSVDDHPDRVLPAFAAAAARGAALRVEGTDHTFDFTHLDDTVRGLIALTELLQSGDRPPPVHFVTGTSTTLGQAARLAIELAASSSTIAEAPPRTYDVSQFRGDPSRARSLLGWAPTVPLHQGLGRLIADFRARRPVDSAVSQGAEA